MLAFGYKPTNTYTHIHIIFVSTYIEDKTHKDKTHNPQTNKAHRVHTRHTKTQDKHTHTPYMQQTTIHRRHAKHN